MDDLKRQGFPASYVREVWKKHVHDEGDSLKEELSTQMGFLSFQLKLKSSKIDR